VAQLDFSSSPKVFTASYSSVACHADDFASESRHFDGCACPTILFVGSLAQMYKGLDVLLKAVQLVLRRKDLQVVVIGDGKFRAELQRLAGSLGISGKVQFLGELPSGRAIREQLDRATVFALPSRTEGLPRALIEAMARALPCVGSRVGGIPELLSEDDMVPTEDYVGLAEKLVEVISDPARLSKMSQRNLERAQEYRPEVLDRRRTEFYRCLRQRTESSEQCQLNHPLTTGAAI
jgi:glycosyltransferase involved in cell wall biosynthesis